MFIVPDLAESDELLVDGAEGRHAVEVLRLSPGERVRIGDGRGLVADGDVLSGGRGPLGGRSVPVRGAGTRSGVRAGPGAAEG